MGSIVSAVFAPGFFSSARCTRAARRRRGRAVSGAVGVFTVLRSQSFAGHALSDLGTLGGSGAVPGRGRPAVGLRRSPGSPSAAPWTWPAPSAAAAAATCHRHRARRGARRLRAAALSGHRPARHHRRDGHGAVRLPVRRHRLTVPAAAALRRARPRRCSSCSTGRCCSARVNPDLAAARGVRVRLLSLVLPAGHGRDGGPELADRRHDPQPGAADRPGRDGAAADPAARPRRWPSAAAIGLAATWLGVLLAYDSYYWPPHGGGWPVSFFVVALIFLAYLAGGPAPARTGPAGPPDQAVRAAPTGPTPVHRGQAEPCSRPS